MMREGWEREREIERKALNDSWPMSRAISHFSFYPITQK